MFILTILLILSLPSHPVYVRADNTRTYFARIMYDDVCLYKQALDINDSSNVYFTLPRTYFVELLDDIDSYYKVNYNGISGYVKKESVQPIAGTPQNPYLTNITFRIYSDQSRSLRSEPSENGGPSTQIAYIPLLNRNLTYYGTIIGQSLIDGRTNIWYYCKYTADKDYYGYVYSDFCDEMSIITENKENVTFISDPIFSTPEEEQIAIPINNKNTMTIVCILSIPAIVFVFMILKSSIILNNEKSSRKEIKEY